MRRLFVTLLILLFAAQVKAECLGDVGVFFKFHAAATLFGPSSLGEAKAASPVVSGLPVAANPVAARPVLDLPAAPDKRTPTVFDAATAGQAPHADFSDSISSHAPLPHQGLVRSAWHSLVAPAVIPLYHPLFKPPPI